MTEQITLSVFHQPSTPGTFPPQSFGTSFFLCLKHSSPDLRLVCSFLSFKLLLSCHLLREVFLDHPIKLHSSPPSSLISLPVFNNVTAIITFNMLSILLICYLLPPVSLKQYISAKKTGLSSVLFPFIFNSAFIFIPCILNSAWTMADAQWILVE